MSTHECKWYSLLVFVIITCDRKKCLWIRLLITVSPDRKRSGAQPDGYSRLTSDYGLRTMDYKSWHKFHCLNKLLSHEHTESHLMPLFYKHQECFECKVHWSFKEIGLKYQSYGFKNIYSKSEQWTRLIWLQRLSTRFLAKLFWWQCLPGGGTCYLDLAGGVPLPRVTFRAQIP